VKKPDFSGEYVLNRHASTLGPGAAAARGARLRITHSEPDVRLEGKFEFDGSAFEFSSELVADGRKVVDQERGTSASLSWDDNALVFEDRTDRPEMQMIMSWRYELEDDGRRLTATEHMTGAGRDQHNIWVFERR
jgi:hypothetical protein